MQLSCTRKLTGNIYPRCSLFLQPHFGFSQLSYTYVMGGGKWYSAKHRAGNFHRWNASRMCKTTRALLGQSAQAHSVNFNPHPYQTWRFGLCRVIDGVTIEINSPNWQEMHWIREMLRQDMVVERQTTATYIEVVVQWCHLFFFLFDTVHVPVFHLSKNRTDSLYRCARLTAYRYTRLLMTSRVYIVFTGTFSETIWDIKFNIAHTHTILS